jgi:hypothetical protein
MGRAIPIFAIYQNENKIFQGDLGWHRESCIIEYSNVRLFKCVSGGTHHCAFDLFYFMDEVVKLDKLQAVCVRTPTLEFQPTLAFFSNVRDERRQQIQK